MTIGIIVYSYTNNTLTIAQQLKEALTNKGYQADIESIKAFNEDPNNTNIVLSNIPRLKQYKKLIFATCVRGFDCAPIFKAYMNTIDSLKDQKCAGFVSQYFPWDALGGTQSLKRMKELVENKNGIFMPLRSIHVKSKQKETQINELISKCMNWIQS